MSKRGVALVKVEIRWSKRGGRVTSLTGGHTAQFEEMGDQMIITIFQEQAKLKRGGRGAKR